MANKINDQHQFNHHKHVNSIIEYYIFKAVRFEIDDMNSLIANHVKQPNYLN